VLDTLYRQSVLITGAGGSIGSALALRLAGLAPSILVLLESSESHLYALQREWAEAGVAAPTVCYLGSVDDRRLLDHIFAMHNPGLVYHAAAFKHVPLMEQHPLAAISNNIFGTRTLVAAAAAHGAQVVQLSTDKAVEPTSVMGATKRAAEHIVLAAGGTVLRLGNVLASRDSVVEVFARQIGAGGPLTVTDPAARRYFLTLDEAVNLLLIAAAEPEPPVLLTPALPAAHYIADLAQYMAHKLAPNRTIAIDFTHPRPGDKETEQLWSAGESARPAHQRGLLMVQSPVLPDGQLQTELTVLRGALDVRDLSAAIAQLRVMVPDYRPSPALLALASERDPRVSQ